MPDHPERQRPPGSSLSDPADPNYILAANPLSKPETLYAALAFAAKEFPPVGHRFILMTGSHGNASKALTPRLAIRAEKTNREEVLRMTAGQPVGETLPEWSGSLGITKTEYVRALADAGRDHGMHFSLVFMEACSAYTNELRPENLPENVERLMVIRKPCHYINLLLGDILYDMKPSDRLADAMTRGLPPKFLILRHGDEAPPDASPPASQTLTWLYFIPLGGWIGWVLWRLLRASPKKMATDEHR